MKKRSVLIITLLVLVGVLAATLVGCSMKQADILELAKFAQSSEEASRDVAITITSGGSTVYKKVGATVEKPYEINAGDFVIGSTGAIALDYTEDKFEDIQYLIGEDKVAVYTARIKDSVSFLGVANSSNAKVEIKADSKGKKLLSTKLTYVATGSVTYDVEIVLTMVY